MQNWLSCLLMILLYVSTVWAEAPNRVLNANQDSRAQDILATAHRLMQERTLKIAYEDLRQLFLENVTAHREIRSEFEKGE